MSANVISSKLEDVVVSQLIFYNIKDLHQKHSVRIEIVNATMTIWDVEWFSQKAENTRR